MRYTIAVTICSVFLALFVAAPAFAADCTNPARPEGASIYNQDFHVMQYCNGTEWVAMGSITPAAGGDTISICRFSAKTNGNIGPICGTGGGTPTWKECAIQTCGVLNTSATNDFKYCQDIEESDASSTYYEIQDQCSDGSCDNDYAIYEGVFLCVDR